MPEVINASTFKSAASQGSPLPKQNYIVQVKSVDQTPNTKPSKNCPQDKLVLEVLAPDTVMFEGTQVAAAGREVDMYITYSRPNMANCRDLLKKLGLDEADSLEVTMPTADEVSSGQLTRVAEYQDWTRDLVGKQFVVTLSTVQQPERAINPATGKSDWKQDIVKDAAGNVVMSSFHRANLPGKEDVVSGINDPVQL